MRPSHFLGRAILAWCVVGVCSAQALPFPGSVATRGFAESFLLGFQLAVHKGREQGKVSEKVDSCVAKLDATATFGAIIQAQLVQIFTSPERQELDTFFSSPVGKKFIRQGVLQVYSQTGTPPPEPAPTYSASETAELDRFRHTSTGTKLMDPSTMAPLTEPPGARERLLEVLSSCGK